MKRTLFKAFFVLAVLFSITAFATSQPSVISDDVPSQDPSKADISPELRSKFETSPGMLSTQSTKKVQVMVSLKDYQGRPNISEMKERSSTSQRGLRKLAEKSPKVELENQFWITNAVLLEVDSNFPIENIAGVKGVRRLGTNAKVSVLQSPSDMSTTSEVSPKASTSTYGLKQINATDVWSDYGTQGSGVKVSVVDTGIDNGHQDLELYTDDSSDPTYPGGWAEFDGGRVTGSEPKTCEYGGGDHGTHVSGTVSGGDASGDNIGVAPDVDLMNAGALMVGQEDSNGDLVCVGYTSDIIDGMEWSVNNGADVVSMSLGSTCTQRDLYISAVRNAESAGSLVVAASGNEGEGCSGSPGNVYESFAVGASDSAGDIANFSSGEEIDKSADWSSPPSSWPSNYIVPDVAGPGYGVYSSEPGDSYGYKYGTSMATPHVSGAAALMESATAVDLTPAQIKESFVQTAWKPSDWSESSASSSIEGQDTRYGHGIIDAYAATGYAISAFDQPEYLNVVSVEEKAGNQGKIMVEVKSSKDYTIKDDFFQINVANDGGLDGLDVDDYASVNKSGMAEFSFNETGASTYNPEFVLSSNSSVTGTGTVVVEASSPADLTASNQSATAGQRESIVLNLNDAYGNSISGKTISVKESDGLNLLSNSENTDSSGQASIDFNETGSSVYSPVFENPGSGVTETVSVDIKPAAVSQLNFTGQPSKTVAGEKIKTESGSFIEVEGLDKYGNLNTGFSSSVTLSTNESSDLQTVSASNGKASFDNAKISEAASYNLEASSSGVDMDTSNVFDVVPGDAESLSIVKHPSNGVAGAQFASTVVVNDSEGNPVSNVSVDAVINESGFVSGTTSVKTNSSGEASFDDLVIEDSGNYSLNFSLDGNDGNVASSVSKGSNGFEVAAAAANKIVFTRNSSSVVAGNRSEFTVELRDLYSNPTINHSGFDDVIEAAEGVLEPEKVNISSSESEKSFNWSNTKTGDYTISTNTSVSDSQHVISVTPGEINASQTNVTSEKTNITADGSSTSNITVVGRDEYGNLLETGGANITLNTTAGSLLDTVQDQGNGNYTQQLQASTNLETAQINASIDDQEVTEKASVDFAAGTPSVIGVSKSGNATADNQDKIEVRVEINDSYSNPVKELEVDDSVPENLNVSRSNKTDKDGEAFFNFTTRDADTYNVGFSASGLSKNVSLTFEPGEPKEIDFNNISNQEVGEPFNITLSIVDDYDNIVTSYSNKSSLSSSVDITPSETANFTNGRLKNQTVTLDYNDTVQGLKINASDTITGQSNSFNLTAPDAPTIGVFKANSTLLLENETVGIGFNDTVYSFDNDVERTLNMSDQKLTLQNSENYDFKADYSSGTVKDYVLNLTVTDVFGQTVSKTKNISYRDPSQFSANISGSTPSWSFKDPEGNVREQNSTSEINSTLPSDDNWTLSMESDNQTVEFKSVNVTEDVNESFELQTGLTPQIEDLENTRALALNTSMNFSSADVSADVVADRAQKCSDWDFQNQGCGGTWENVTDRADFSNSEASITVSSFSAYAFGESVEDDGDDNSDDGGDDGSSGGSGGGSSGGGAPVGGGAFSDPDIVVEESENEVFIYNIFEAQKIDFNETELPIKSLRFNSSPENGTIRFEASSINDSSVSYESFISAESSFSGPFELEVLVSKDWLNEKRFEPENVSVYTPEDQNAELVEESEDDVIYSVRLENMSSFGIGVDQACYSMKSVDAVYNGSCKAYETPCDVSESAEVVGSCSEWEQQNREKQELEERISNLRNSGIDDERTALLEDAEKALEAGNTSQAQETVSEIETLERKDRRNKFIFAALVALAILLTFIVWKVYHGFRKRPFTSDVEELTEVVKDLAEQGEDVGHLFVELKQVRNEIDNREYDSAADTVEDIEAELEDFYLD